jgi:hypothetical protein
MERGIEGMEWMASAPNPHEAGGSLTGAPPEWRGTGLCAEAQADGVPCTVAGRACDTCPRAVAAHAGPVPPPARRH